MKVFILILSVIIILNTGILGQNNLMYFDGDDDFVLLDHDIFKNLTAFTISVWIKPEPGGMIISNHTHGTYWESVELSNTWFIVNSGNGDGSRQILRFEDINDSTWHHFAGVWDGKTMQLYLDGQPYDTTQTATSSPWSSPAMIAIGARISNVQPPAVAEFKGYMDEFTVWRRSLIPEQIKRIMADTLTSEYYTSADSGLIAYWQFDESEGDSVFDKSVNNFNGYISGATRMESDIPLSLFDHKNLITIPDEAVLWQNYPNPFNPVTVISWQLAVGSRVELTVYNMRGQKVAKLVDANQSAGRHSIEWHAGNLASGVYIYCLSTDYGFRQTKKLILLK